MILRTMGIIEYMNVCVYMYILSTCGTQVHPVIGVPLTADRGVQDIEITCTTLLRVHNSRKI